MVEPVFAALLDLMFPTACAGCGVVGRAACPRCLAELGRLRQVHRLTLPAGLPTHALGGYRGAARELVLGYKERARRDLTGPLAGAMAAALPRLPGARPDSVGRWWLVPAPSRSSTARYRGGQHMLRLAKRVAAELIGNGRPATALHALRLSRDAKDSVGLSAAARTANLAGRMRLRCATGSLPPRGTPVVLLDDVLTTGTTAAACVATLATAGLRVVAVLVLTEAGRVKALDEGFGDQPIEVSVRN